MNAVSYHAPDSSRVAANFTISNIRQCLKPNPVTSTSTKGRCAAVAMILIGAPQAKELLFIRRAEYEGDPWSGDVAFPGGGVEEQDRDNRATAERETAEEIGLILTPENYLGALGTIRGAYLPISIACHVYHLEKQPALSPNNEVVQAFCVPLTLLLEPERNTLRKFAYRGECHTHPTIDLSGYCDRFLWGISYRLLQKFFSELTPPTPHIQD